MKLVVFVSLFPGPGLFGQSGTAAAEQGSKQSVDPQKVTALAKEADDFAQQCERLREINSGWEIFLATIGIVAGFGVIVAGMADKPKIAASLGAAITAATGAQAYFKVGDRETFFGVLGAESAELSTKIRYKVRDQKQFDDAVDVFASLKRAKSDLPKTSGSQAIRDLYQKSAQ